jgi:hypothetical protein
VYARDIFHTYVYTHPPSFSLRSWFSTTQNVGINIRESVSAVTRDSEIHVKPGSTNTKRPKLSRSEAWVHLHSPMYRHSRYGAESVYERPSLMGSIGSDLTHTSTEIWIRFHSSYLKTDLDTFPTTALCLAIWMSSISLCIFFYYTSCHCEGGARLGKKTHFLRQKV